MTTPEEPTAYWTTEVADVADADVFLRGYSLTELMGELPFAGAAYLLIRGEIPTPGQARMLDMMLCSILDYSLYKPGTAAARYAVSGNPQMTAGMAVAVLSVGEYTLAPEDAGAFIAESYADYKDSGRPMREAAEDLVAELTAQRRRVPGFGHPEFKFKDPRAQNLRRTAVEEDVWGGACDWYEAIHEAFVTAIERPQVPINEVGMMAAILVQMGFAPAEMTGIALISSMPGVVAHVSEEIKGGTRMRIIPDQIAEYPRRRRDLAADLAAKGWATAGARE